jgi:high-affinity iron transporter
VLPSYLLSLREGLEAALIIGIVLGALRKIHRQDLNRVVWSGTLSAAAISFMVAMILQGVGASLEGTAEGVFEGTTVFLAAGVLTWMVFWMHHQSRTIKSSLELGVRHAVSQSGVRALFFLAFLAVLREGVELALFLTATTFALNAQQTLIGAALGLGTAVLLGWSLFATTIRLDLRRFFQITGALLILFAAGLVAYGVHEFNEIGWIPSLVEHVWDINFFLSEQSTLGLMLKALFGYNANPSLTEVLAYISYFAAITIGLRHSRATLPSVQNA